MEKTIYFDCTRGAAGDMICAALYELVADRPQILDKLNSLGLPGVEYIPYTCEKYGIRGTGMRVKIHGEEEGEEAEKNASHFHPAAHLHGQSCSGHTHHHMTLEEIREIIRNLSACETVKKAVFDIYELIAKAESEAHQCTVEEVHFHEVGAMDAIADITAACVLMNEIHPAKVLSSPVQVGGGTVKCAHGVLPVPAPATANILKDLPTSADYISEELCTPTGAALIRYFSDVFCNTEHSSSGNRIQTGIGIGKKTFDKPSYFAASILQ